MNPAMSTGLFLDIACLIQKHRQRINQLQQLQYCPG